MRTHTHSQRCKKMNIEDAYQVAKALWERGIDAERATRMGATKPVIVALLLIDLGAFA